MSVQALSCAIAVRGVSASEKLLLLVLANYADDRMTCWPSHKKMAAEACLSERTILTLLKSLEARQIISRQERFRSDGSRTTDAITLHFSGEVISPHGEADDTGVGKSTVGGGAQIAPLTTFEPSLEPSKELRTEANASAPAPKTSDEKAWDEALGLLVGQGAMKPDRARAFFGGLLKAHGLEPRDMLGAINEAYAKGTRDPQSYLKASAMARQRGKAATGPPKRVGFV